MMNDELDPIEPEQNPLHEEMMSDMVQEMHNDMVEPPIEEENEESDEDYRRRIAEEAEGDIFHSQFDNDPSPYDGTYSEM